MVKKCTKNMPKHIYIMSNPDWVKKYKYGYTIDLNNRLCCSHEQHSSLTNFEYIFELQILPGKFKFLKYKKEFDRIFSHLLRKKNYTKLINTFTSFNHLEDSLY